MMTIHCAICGSAFQPHQRTCNPKYCKPCRDARLDEKVIIKAWYQAEISLTKAVVRLKKLGFIYHHYGNDKAGEWEHPRTGEILPFEDAVKKFLPPDCQLDRPAVSNLSRPAKARASENPSAGVSVSHGVKQGP